MFNRRFFCTQQISGATGDDYPYLIQHPNDRAEVPGPGPVPIDIFNLTPVNVSA